MQWFLKDQNQAGLVLFQYQDQPFFSTIISSFKTVFIGTEKATAMKKFILIAAIIAVSTTCFSQVKFGPQVTASLASASIDPGDNTEFKKTPEAAFGIGVLAEIPLTGSFSLRPSLNLLLKGVSLKASGEDEGGFGSFDLDVTNKLYYAELPVLATWNIALSNSKLYFGAGPSLGVGLFGKSKATYSIHFPGMPVMTETENADAFKNEENEGAGFKRVDLSANAVAGVQWNNGLYVNAGYLHGFSNLQKDDDGSSYRNRSFQLTVGFLLGGK